MTPRKKRLFLLRLFFAWVWVVRGEETQRTPIPEAALPVLSAKQPPKNLKVEISFAGAVKFRETELRAAIADQLEAINESGLNAATADDAAFFLALFYRKQGYAQAEVKPEIVSPTHLTLRIKAGPPTVIGAITFHGNKTFSEQTLREYIVGPTRERFSRLKKEVPFVEADVLGGVGQLRSFYESEGFLHAKIDAPSITFSPDKTRAFIVIPIDEGSRYYFAEPEFSGDVLFFPISKMRKPLEPFLAKPFSNFQVTNMQRALLYFYKQQGYFDAKIDVETDVEHAHDHRVPLHFTVSAGRIFRFDGVEKIEGLDRLHPQFLERRFGSLSGKIYNPDALEETFRDVMKTGLFKTLRVTPQPREDNTLALDLQAEEARAREVGVSFGYGSYEGAVVGLHAAERNVFGTGRSASATLQWSSRELLGEIVLNDPWFLDTRFGLRVRAYAQQEDFDGYSKVETGLRFELSRQITKQFEVTAFLLGRIVNLESTGIEESFMGPTSYQSSTVGLTETLDFRDSALNPGRGWVFTSTQDVAVPVIGKFEFMRATGRISYYLPIKKTLLAFGARAGVLDPFTRDESIPIDERFFNGGARSVRSFIERRLGPRDPNGFPLGGETFTQFNIEYSFPIWGDLEGAIFTDAGSVGRTISDGFGTMRYGVGGGLRYKLPIGPLRLDYGVNPAPRQHESPGAFHFSFGAAF